MADLNWKYAKNMFLTRVHEAFYWKLSQVCIGVAARLRSVRPQRPRGECQSEVARGPGRLARARPASV